MRFRGMLYRALNPIHARAPLSGRGAELYGGRFNPKGMPALYTSLSILTALREANQVGHLQPTTLVSYTANVERVLDSRDPAVLAGEDITAEDLADPAWRDQMHRHGEAPTQTMARRLVAKGYDGLIVRSFAAGAGPDDVNLVLWHWDGLVLIDDEKRLSR